MTQLLGLIIVTILTASCFGWIWSIGRWKAGLPLLEREARRHVPWGLFDVIAGAMLTIVGIGLSLLLVRELGWFPAVRDGAEPTLAALRVGTLTEAIAKLIFLSAVVLLVALRTEASLRNFGWSAGSLLRDIGTGTMAFAMLAPIVFGIQAILVQFVPSKHPLIEMLKSNHDLPLFAIIAFSAAVAAPLAEEFFFRVLLQGWLEAAFQSGGTLRELLVGTDYPDASEMPQLVPVVKLAEEHDEPELIRAEVATKHWSDLTRRFTAWVAIAITSVIFALLHWSHGPDWIPLLVLAIGLGYLYERTHRIVPSLTVHVLLNSFTVLALGAEIFGKRLS